MRRAEYIAFYKNLLRSGFAQKSLSRMYNAINQFILMLRDLNKMVIHADSGNVILLFMNISLACDYRIVADNTVYQNPNIELGVVPEGGSVFFLSKMLGAVTASRILLSGEDVTAIQAHQLGIVDKVVPLEYLDRMALETARSYAQLPSGYSSRISKPDGHSRFDLETVAVRRPPPSLIYKLLEVLELVFLHGDDLFRFVSRCG